MSIDFRTPAPCNANDVWDLDNLVKPTLDALDGVFGFRQWAGLKQAADDRVGYIVAAKRTATDGEALGAMITIHLMGA